MNFQKFVLTEAGTSMIASAMNNETICFTKVKLGNGISEDIQNMIDLVNPILEIPITEITVGNNYAQITAKYNNSNVEAGFWIKEIGLFAKYGEGEILYAYASAREKADYLPSGSQYEIVSTTIKLAVIIGDAKNVTAVIGELAMYVSKSDFEKHLQAENPHEITAEDVGLGDVQNASPENQTPKFDINEQESKLENIQSGEKMGIILKKISLAIKTLLLHIADKNNPHKITAQAIAAADEEHEHSTNDITSGMLSITRGGTGSNTASSALRKLGAVPKAGCDNMQGNLEWGNYISGVRGIGGIFVENKRWRVVGKCATDSENGYLELGTGIQGNEPILARQYDQDNWEHIVRTAYILNTDGNTIFPGTCTATSHPTASDLKQKENITEISVELAKQVIYGFRPITYNLIGQWQKTVGLGAQEIFEHLQKIGLENNSLYRAQLKSDNENQKVLTDKEILETDDKKLEWSVDYVQIIPYLIPILVDYEERLKKLESRSG